LQIQHSGRVVLVGERVDLGQRRRRVLQGVLLQELPGGIEREERQDARQEQVLQTRRGLLGGIGGAVDGILAVGGEVTERRHSRAQHEEHSDEAGQPGQNSDRHDQECDEGIRGARERGDFDHRYRASQPAR